MPVDHADDRARSSIVTPHLPAGAWQLRPLRTTDADFVFTALNEPGMRLARSAPPPADVAASNEWITRAHRSTAQGTYVPWVLVPAGGCEAAGLVVLQEVDRTAGTAEAGYFVSPAARGQGAATSALAAMTRWAFDELGLHRVYLLHDTDNTASCRVALSAGFRVEGVLRASRRRADGSRCDEELHARLRTDEPTGTA